MERTARDRRLGPCPRTLHLIDIENLIGSTGFKTGTVASVAHSYGCLAEIGSVDLVIVASSPFTALPAWCGWPNVRRLARSGPVAADLGSSKSSRLKHPRLLHRLVSVSVYGFFSYPAASLPAHGSAVTVVTPRDALSRQLHFAARDVRYLDVRVAEAQAVDLPDAA
jgi:hypothetical protein